MNNPVPDAGVILAQIESWWGIPSLPDSLEPSSEERLEVDPVDALTHLQRLEAERRREVDYALMELNRKIWPVFAEPKEIAADSAQRHHARTLLSRLLVDTLVDTSHGLDYALELRRRERLASPQHNHLVFFALASVAGWDDGIDRENHGFGYHFHHVSTRRGVSRTNILLTFDPGERVGPPDTLYWEYHGGYSRAKPENWARRRCIAVHSTARPSVQNPGKSHFLRPGRGADVLWSG